MYERVTRTNGSNGERRSAICRNVINSTEHRHCVWSALRSPSKRTTLITPASKPCKENGFLWFSSQNRKLQDKPEIFEKWAFLHGGKVYFEKCCLRPWSWK